jgi:hypothetical protein
MPTLLCVPLHGMALMCQLEQSNTSRHNWLRISVPLNIQNNQAVTNRARKATRSSNDGGRWAHRGAGRRENCVSRTLSHIDLVVYLRTGPRTTDDLASFMQGLMGSSLGPRPPPGPVLTSPIIPNTTQDTSHALLYDRAIILASGGVGKFWAS